MNECTSENELRYEHINSMALLPCTLNFILRASQNDFFVKSYCYGVKGKEVDTSHKKIARNQKANFKK